MLKDRLVLVENEIARLNQICATLYKEVAIGGCIEKVAEYGLVNDQLYLMIGERVEILKLLAEGM